MTAVELAQIVGIFSIYSLFALKIFLAVNKERYSKETMAACTLWTAMYFYFLGFLRLLSFMELATSDALRVVSGWSSLIPLVAVIVHLFFMKGKQLTEENIKFDATEDAKRSNELQT
jgi:hypothetical protein